MFAHTDYLKALAFFKINEPIIYNIMIQHGYKVPNYQKNIFSHLIGSIIGQKIRFRQARTLRGKLYQTLGKNNFEPEDIINLGVNGLIEIGLENNIANLIYYVTNEIKLENLDDLDKLHQVKGIGPWTVNCTKIMIDLTNDKENIQTNILLTEDLIIKRNIKKYFNITLKKDINNLMEKWNPWNTIVTWYLWRETTCRLP